MSTRPSHGPRPRRERGRRLCSYLRYLQLRMVGSFRQANFNSDAWLAGLNRPTTAMSRTCRLQRGPGGGAR
eukprot:8752337-Pyramimonas_sp.AAC.1